MGNLASLHPTFNSAFDAVVVVDDAGIIRSWNTVAVETFGWTESEAIGRSFDEMIVPVALWSAHIQGVKRYQTSGQACLLDQNLEMEVLHRGGWKVPVELKTTEVTLDLERFFISYLRDISKRPVAAGRWCDDDPPLAANEARFRLLSKIARAVVNLSAADEILAVTMKLLGQHLEVSCCAYADIDPDGEGISFLGDWTSPGSPSIVGNYQLAHFGRRAIANLWSGRPLVINKSQESGPERADVFQAIGLNASVVVPLVKGGRLRALMTIHDQLARTWSSDEVVLLAEVATLYWAHVELVGAEAALRRSNERFQAAVQAVNGVLWTNNAEGRMTGEQVGWSRLTGQSRRDYEGYGWSTAVHPDDRERTLEAWREAITGRRPFIFEHRLLCHDQEWRTFSIRAIPTLELNGAVREWVGVHTDVTDRRGNEARAPGGIVSPN